MQLVVIPDDASKAQGFLVHQHIVNLVAWSLATGPEGFRCHRHEAH
jgi:hypothetical protein